MDKAWLFNARAVRDSFQNKKSMENALVVNIKQAAKEIEKDIIKWRRELHQIPELGADLPQTSSYVRQKMNEFGIEYSTFSNMGIMATLYGGEKGPTIAFRADMDALPIQEETELPFSSLNGNMHACGHDAHTAMLIGAAKILSEHKDRLCGNVKFIFQPAEETTGGAADMIHEGCLDHPKADRVVALHIGSLFENVGNGQFGTRKGAMMASVDSFSVKVNGKGGHGAKPHECIDPVIIACEMILSLQKIISREIKATHGAVITVGMLRAGSAVNIVPDHAEFAGTIRVLNPDDRVLIERRLETLVHKIAEASGAWADFTYKHYYPPTVNSGEVVDFFSECAAKITGNENVIEIDDPSMGTEDVAYFLEKTPGVFSILGSRKRHKDGKFYPHHNSRFDLDESVLWMGTAVFVQCALDFCKA